MKKQLAIFLLISILLNGLILFFLSTLGEYGAKMHYALHKYSTKEEVTFYFTEAELRSYTKDKDELLINNQMYDMLTSVHENGLVKVTCVIDKHETFFVNLMRSNSTAIDHMKTQKQVVHLLQYLTLVSCNQQQTFQCALYQQEQTLAEKRVLLIDHSYELDTPPPQL